MTEKFYNDMFGGRFTPKTIPWRSPAKHDWPSLEEQEAYWAAQESDIPHDRLHRCPQCGCLFTGGEA